MKETYYLLNKIITVNVPNHGTIHIYTYTHPGSRKTPNTTDKKKKS